MVEALIGLSGLVGIGLQVAGVALGIASFFRRADACYEAPFVLLLIGDGLQDLARRFTP